MRPKGSIINLWSYTLTELILGRVLGSVGKSVHFGEQRAVCCNRKESTVNITILDWSLKSFLCSNNLLNITLLTCLHCNTWHGWNGHSTLRLRISILFLQSTDSSRSRRDETARKDDVKMSQTSRAGSLQCWNLPLCHDEDYFTTNPARKETKVLRQARDRVEAELTWNNEINWSLPSVKPFRKWFNILPLQMICYKLSDPN